MNTKIAWHIAEDVVSLWNSWRDNNNSLETNLYATVEANKVILTNKGKNRVKFHKNKNMEFDADIFHNGIFISSEDKSDNEIFLVEMEFLFGFTGDDLITIKNTNNFNSKFFE